MTTVYDSWVVAALVLRDEPMGLHYREITRRVLQSGLAILGRKAETPSQTIGCILRKTKWNGERVFDNPWRGFYRLVDRQKAQEYPPVKEALRVEELRREACCEAAKKEEQLARMKRRVRSLTARLRNMTASLRQIVETGGAS